jgi:hypothetical protein
MDSPVLGPAELLCILSIHKEGNLTRHLDDTAAATAHHLFNRPDYSDSRDGLPAVLDPVQFDLADFYAHVTAFFVFLFLPAGSNTNSE